MTLSRIAERVIAGPKLPTEVRRPEVMITPEARDVLNILVERAVAKNLGLEDPHADKVVAIVAEGGAMRGFITGFIIASLLMAGDEHNTRLPVRKTSSHKLVNPYTQADLLIGASSGAINHYIACAQEPGSLELYLKEIPERKQPQPLGKRLLNAIRRRPIPPEEDQILSFTRRHPLHMDPLLLALAKHAPSEETMRTQRAKVYAVTSTDTGETSVEQLNNLTQEQALNVVTAGGWLPVAATGTPIMKNGRQQIDGGLAENGNLLKIAADKGATHVLYIPTSGIGESSDLIPHHLLPLTRVAVSNYILQRFQEIGEDGEQKKAWVLNSLTRPSFLLDKTIGGIFVTGSNIKRITVNNSGMRADGNHIYMEVIMCLNELRHDAEMKFSQATANVTRRRAI